MMRFLIASTSASLLIGAALLSAAPASAEDDIYFNHAKGTMSGAATTAAPAQSYHGQYLQEEQRDTHVQASVSDDAAFNHAKGTMSGAVPESAPSTSGNYVASYNKYMQMDPRDATVDPNAEKSVDAANPWFNHAKGTMSAD